MHRDTLQQLKGKIICVAGLPASGKSTFCAELERHINDENIGFRARYFPEHVHKPLLDAYLASPESQKKYAFSFQFIMAQRRISTYREALLFAQNGGVALVDGPLQTDMAFALLNYKSGFIDEKDYQIYLSMLTEYDELPKPDYLIYLDVSPATAHRRLMRRDRKSELSVYDDSFYNTLREMNKIAFGSLSVSLIDYNNDDELMSSSLVDLPTLNHSVNLTKEPIRPISRDYLYRVVSEVISGKKLRQGL